MMPQCSADLLTPALVLADPYVLDFLGLQDRYPEKNLEDAILRELKNFLLELGAGFIFVARQKRLQIDNDDFCIDLLFYNRSLKRLVAMLRELTRSRLLASRAKGRIGGRRPKLTSRQQKRIVRLFDSGQKAAADSARLFNAMFIRPSWRDC